MRVKQADPAVILVDILSEVGAVPAICRAAFGRFRSATQRGLGAIAAETKDVDVAELLRAPEIEESFSLGADLTASFFGSAGNWLPMARLASRRASRNAGLVDQAEELMALAVAAWSEEALCRGLRRGRTVGQGTTEIMLPPPRLLPVFAGHDRSSHAERQALLRILRGCSPLDGAGSCEARK